MEVKRNAGIAIKVLSKAFADVEVLLLHDRDTRTDEGRTQWIATGTNYRMLSRREIENYLFDYEVLSAYGLSRTRVVPQPEYDAIVSDIRTQDLKVGDVTLRIKELCGDETMSHDQFKRTLAGAMIGTQAAAELERDIFATP